MAEKSTERWYWDSNCFLGWLLQEADKVDDLRQVLDRADDGDFDIFTSTVTQTEVLLMRGGPKVPASKRDLVRAFFRRSYIHVVPLFPNEAEMAQDLVWDHRIKPKDALHLASAISAKADRFHTYDDPLLRRKSITLLGRRIIIEKPQVSQMSLNYGGP